MARDGRETALSFKQLKTAMERADATDRRRQRQIALQAERLDAMAKTIRELAVEVRSLEQKDPAVVAEGGARTPNKIIEDAIVRAEGGE